RRPCLARDPSAHARGPAHDGTSRLARLSPSVCGSGGGGGAAAPGPGRPPEHAPTSDRGGPSHRTVRLASGGARSTRGRDRTFSTRRRAPAVARRVSQADDPAAGAGTSWSSWTGDRGDSPQTVIRVTNRSVTGYSDADRDPAARTAGVSLYRSCWRAWRRVVFSPY